MFNKKALNNVRNSRHGGGGGRGGGDVATSKEAELTGDGRAEFHLLHLGQKKVLVSLKKKPVIESTQRLHEAVGWASCDPF